MKQYTFGLRYYRAVGPRVVVSGQARSDGDDEADARRKLLARFHRCGMMVRELRLLWAEAVTAYQK